MNNTGMKSKFSVKRAHKTQSRLSNKIILHDMIPEEIHFVAGVDVTYVRDLSIGAVVVLEYGSLELVESKTALCKTLFPYIPTLLSFREVPPAVLSIRKLQVQPDIILIDAHGFAHPYRCGFASHLGVVINKPTIGVAKRRLFGRIEEAKAGEDALLKHDDEVIGAVVTTKCGCKPVFVSVGHMISLKTAVKIVKHCVHYRRIPEPILKAHELASEEKRKINNNFDANR